MVVLTLAAVMATPLGFIGESTPGVAAAPTQDLRIGFMQAIDSLNPYIGMSDSAYVFYGLVYDTLVSVDNDLNPEPNLALSWGPVPLSDAEMIAHPEYPYGSVWQYNLTHNATFTDGEPLTADDVVFTVNLNAGNYSSIWAYQPYSFYMKDAVKVDDYTVRIHYADRISNEPTAAAFAYLISIPILPKHLLVSLSAFEIAFDWNGTFAEDPPVVGTGPFMVTSAIRDEFAAGAQITLERNPNSHWSLDYGMDVHFDRILLKFYDDVSAMSYALGANQIDAASYPQWAFKSFEASAPENVAFYSGPKMTMSWTEVGFNMYNGGPNPSRLDHSIRQALAMATNKSYIADTYYMGLAEPGTTAIAQADDSWHYEPNATEKAQFAFDIVAANELLNDSGYPRPVGDPIGIRTCGPTSAAVTQYGVLEGTPLSYQMLVRHEHPEEKDISQYLKSVWRDLGVNIDLIIVDQPTMMTLVYTYTYDTMISSWSSDVDPNYQLFALSGEAWNGWNDNLWYNSSYEDNYSLSVTTMDSSLRHTYVDNCQRIHYLDCPYIILAYTNQTWAWRTDTFAGWGDWAANPGRSIDNRYTGNPLWFDLIPLAPVPEFPSVVVPVLGMMVVVAIAFVGLRGRHNVG